MAFLYKLFIYHYTRKLNLLKTLNYNLSEGGNNSVLIFQFFYVFVIFSLFTKNTNMYFFKYVYI